MYLYKQKLFEYYDCDRLISKMVTEACGAEENVTAARRYSSSVY